MLSDKETYAPLQLFEYDHKPGNYCLMLTDTHMLQCEEVFAANGREPGGYGWADVALQIIRTSAPELEKKFGMDPEAGMFVAYGTDVDALRELGGLMHAAFHDHASLAELVKNAPYEYD